jgi:hypothetical protein
MPRSMPRSGWPKVHLGDLATAGLVHTLISMVVLSAGSVVLTDMGTPR